MSDDQDNTNPEAAGVTNAAVRHALLSILESETFARSRRERDFLQFVVEETLAGRGERIKAFAIAHEVYGRDDSFDPRTDPIVRVEAGRLRRRLASYYANDGRRETVQIELPKGGYKPVFTSREAVAEPTQFPWSIPTARRLVGSHKYLVVSALVLVAALAVWQSVQPPDEPAGEPSSAVVPEDVATSKPLLAVLPLETLSSDPMEERLAAGLVEAIITDLTKLSGLSVMAHTSLLSLGPDELNLENLARQFGATHTLRGSLERDGDSVRVNFQLLDIGTNTTIWADRLDAGINEPLAIQDQLADHLVTNFLVEVSSQERAALRHRHTLSPEALALYRQALILIMPPNDRDRIIAARHMFQRIIDLDPTFAGGYAGTGFSHAVLALFSGTATSPPDLGFAIEMASKAIEVDPKFGMGYATLAFAYALSSQSDDALSNAREAIAAQPGDAFTQFVYGMALTLSGKPTQALTPLAEAIRLDPVEVRTPYRNVLGISQFVVGEYESARALFDANLQNGGPTGPHMEVFRAATSLALGLEDDARVIIEELNVSNPDFPAESWLKKWIKDSDSLSKTLDSLYSHGLATPRTTT